MNELLRLLEDRERKHDEFKLAETAVHEGRASSYSHEMNAFDIAHGTVLDWLSDTDNLSALLQFMRTQPQGANHGCPWAEDRNALSVMRGVFQHWLDFEREKRAAEGVETTDETHIISPPYWPTHGQLKAFIATLDGLTRQPHASHE